MIKNPVSWLDVSFVLMDALCEDKTKHVLCGINIGTLILILIIAFLPNNVLRIILGLPMVLFFPGYALLAALFPRKGGLEGTKLFALSFGVSTAISHTQ